MTTTPRPSFSVRLGIAEDTSDALYEGVPDHLLHPLQQWVLEAGRWSDGYLGKTMCLRLRITVPDTTNAAWRLSQQKGMDLLDAVDEILAFLVEMDVSGRSEVHALDILLDDAGSAYRVADDEGGLELRVSTGVSEAMRQTITDAEAATSAGSAADHLTAAWRTAYGLHPDPVRAYSEAIKAVECAAHSVVQPNHGRATLGTMLGEIGNARAKFTTAISTPAGGDPIAPVEAMMRALWDGQTSRHGKQTGTVPETLEAARAGVHLAATLVQWFTAGSVIRHP
ncbi:hypothetical protein PV394_12615 [Streptomyces sp. NE06-03E]|uniref:hypothetical protein n=1 Tax=Streptomyces sp. NE06-03E TaxID=3028695 RepID=UPI0029A334DA|nr:hypothetical protein [Streptomyces sp. NE06-03E]MDX3055972.1 hypothetical protein [Streptomyces sp. NE06-03E]